MRLSCADELLLFNGCPGVIGLAVVFSGEQPHVEQVRARVAERWTGLERMNCVLDRAPGGAGTRRGRVFGRRGRPRWVVPGHFDPAAHVSAAESKLDDVWARSVDRPLGGEVPPWRLFVVPDAAHGGGFALALLAQHELLDGRSLSTLMRSLMDGPATAKGPARSAPLTRTGLRAAGRELRAMAAAGQALPVTSPRETYSSYSSVAVCELPAQTVRSARRQPPGGRGATLNELLVGAVAGALRAEYGPVPGWRRREQPVYTAVPCDLRTRANAAELGNALTAVRVAFPVEVDGPVARLRACQAAMATVPDRAAVHAGVLFPAAEALRRTGPWVSSLLSGRGRRSCFAATATTAMKWPGGASTFEGHRLVRTVALPPMRHPGTVSFALAQAGDAFTLTAVGNARPDEARRLADAVITEFDTWARTATPPV
ncbi:DUF1298 domain-containing protein [Streptomyces sp. G44]|uniref:DUF1298 domain-containing protein n=1 Tax=Streptomyces sp. G44 TaxID=2807632 RepID=UPI0019617DCB|nr:DUF1298 domain-containing protein [Streptomyces sp. G44]MBM7171974.1 DUF1298 domain-containing protein [Streptomyces sp. G44]